MRPFYLLRHGESEWNIRRLTQGQTPHPRLTPRGRDQASHAAAAVVHDLADHGWAADHVVSSDLVRAAQTAQIVADVLHVPIRHDPRLREQHLGTLEGRGYAETFAIAETLDWSDPRRPIAGGESPAQVRDRMAEALAARDETVVTVFVSHGDAIRAAIAHLLGFAPNAAPWVDVPNGAVARVTVPPAITWLHA